jgi:DNA ligase-1
MNLDSSAVMALLGDKPEALIQLKESTTNQIAGSLVSRFKTQFTEGKIATMCDDIISAAMGRVSSRFREGKLSEELKALMQVEARQQVNDAMVYLARETAKTEVEAAMVRFLREAEAKLDELITTKVDQAAMTPCQPASPSPDWTVRMSNLALFNQVVNQAAATSSKTEKQEIIRKALNDNGDLGRLFELALSPYITFGVAKLPDPTPPQGPVVVSPETYAMALLDDLAARRATGHLARDEIGRVRGRLDQEQREAFDKILLKDLRAGFSESTVNKARPGTVPVFECQLAPSKLAVLADLKFPIYAEPKFDGYRTIAIKKAGAVTLYSRNGGLFDNFAEVEDFLTSEMRDNTVLDGEMMSPNGFLALQSRAKSERGKHADIPIYYQVFDGMALADWEAQDCLTRFGHRHNELALDVDRMGSTLVRLTDNAYCEGLLEVEAFYAQCLSLGLEGIMLKQPGGGYTFKRNATWMKMKPFDTADLQVYDLTEGKGKYSGMLGALRCSGTHHGKFIDVNVSGMNDALRVEIWTNPDDYLKQWVEVKYQDITQSDGSIDTWSLRFPSIKRFRGFNKI